MNRSKDNIRLPPFSHIVVAQLSALLVSMLRNWMIFD